jgi:hypothetical protein
MMGEGGTKYDDFNGDVMIDSTKSYLNDPWWTWDFNIIVDQHLTEMGLGYGPIRDWQKSNLMHQLADPAFNPWLSAAYFGPDQRSTRQFLQTWAEVLAAFNLPYRTYSSWTQWPQQDPISACPGDCYVNMVRAAAATLPGFTDGTGVTGDAAWTWISTNGNATSTMASDPRWAIVPRITVTPPVSYPIRRRIVR